MPRPKKENFNISDLDTALGTSEMPQKPVIAEDKIQTLGEEKMAEIKHVVRTIARNNQTTYAGGQLTAVSLTETEMYLNQLVAAGWKLFHVQMTNEKELTFDMLYILTKNQ